MHKLAISCRDEDREWIDSRRSRIVLHDESISLVEQVRNWLMSLSVPKDNIISAPNNSEALRVLSEGEADNALLSGIPLDDLGKVKAVASLRELSRTDCQIIFWANSGVADQVMKIISLGNLGNRFQVLDKARTKNIQDKMLETFSLIFPPFRHRI